MDKPSFVSEEVPHGRSGSTIRGGGIWQTLVREFMESGLMSARVNIGERNYKQAYASIAHAIKVMDLRLQVRAVRRNEFERVYLQRIESESGGNGNGNGHSAEVTPATATTDDGSVAAA